MNFNQSLDDNKKEFVQRLMQAGWKKKDAEREYERIQSEEG